MKKRGKSGKSSTPPPPRWTCDDSKSLSAKRPATAEGNLNSPQLDNKYQESLTATSTPQSGSGMIRRFSQRGPPTRTAREDRTLGRRLSRTTPMLRSVLFIGWVHGTEAMSRDLTDRSLQPVVERDILLDSDPFDIFISPKSST